MTQEERQQLTASLLQGGQTVIHQLQIGDGNTMNYYESKEQTNGTEVKQASPEVVSRALGKSGDYIWGNSAYAVAFCVCRDVFGWQDNASFFERQMELQGILFPPGTVNAAINRNPYMKMNVAKWDQNGAMERVLKLRDELLEKIAEEAPE